MEDLKVKVSFKFTNGQSNEMHFDIPPTDSVRGSLTTLMAAIVENSIIKYDLGVEITFKVYRDEG